MLLTIKINTGNDAMLSWGDMARALNDLASKMMIKDGQEVDEDSGVILDLNGQGVGAWRVEEK